MPTEEFNLARVFETMATTVPDRPCIVWGERSFTFGTIDERSTRLASYLHGRGLGLRRERSELEPHESGQDLLAIALYNGNEYVEAMVGSYRARVAPFNVNYRYVGEELRYLLADAKPKALVYHASLAPVLAEVLPSVGGIDVLLHVPDESQHALLPGAVDYEEALASAPATKPPVEPQPEDLYVLYTGGTTGMPKGVLWRQHDIFMAAMGGRSIGTWQELENYEALQEKFRNGGALRLLLLPPLMHGAAQWSAFILMTEGATIVLPEDTRRMHPADVWRTVERDKVNMIAVVGDAMARPLVEELEHNSYDTSTLFAVGSGGAPLTPSIKERLLEQLPNVVVTDTAGSSETGVQMTHVSARAAVATGRFTPGPHTVVVSAELDRVVKPGHEGLGWLAQRGAVPLGYLDDADKTSRTFPVIEGVRYSIPGDRARHLDDGQIELLGRDSVTINSGGEKIFAEEVERAIADHPSVFDVVVAGRPSERWGEEVVAIVALAPGAALDDDELISHAATRIARYKLPKVVVVVDEVVRSPSGKADYRWAREQAAKA